MREFLLLLITCSITMSVIALVLMLITPFISKKYTAKVRYYAWMVIVLGLIIPFRPQIAPPIIQAEVPASRTAVTFPAALTRDTTPAPAADLSSNALTQPDSGNIAGAIEPETLLLGVWLFVAAAIVIYQISKHIRFMKLVKRWSSKVIDAETHFIMESLCGKLGIRKKLDVLNCDCVSAPMLTGLLKPRILLPNAEYTHSELAFILEHELVHHKRKDLGYKALVLLAGAVHWFNPLMYFIRKEIDTLCEISCDEEVLRHSDMKKRYQYSETVVGVIRHKANVQTAFATSFYGGKKGLKQRIGSIMDGSKKKAGLAVLAIVFVATAATGVVLSLSDRQEVPIPWSSFTSGPSDTLVYLKGEELSRFMAQLKSYKVDIPSDKADSEEMTSQFSRLGLDWKDPARFEFADGISVVYYPEDVLFIQGVLFQGRNVKVKLGSEIFETMTEEQIGAIEDQGREIVIEELKDGQLSDSKTLEQNITSALSEKLGIKEKLWVVKATRIKNS